MVFTFINFVLVLAVAGITSYAMFGQVAKQLSSLLLSLAAGLFVLWCGAVGLYHVTLNLFYVPQAITHIMTLL